MRRHVFVDLCRVGLLLSDLAISTAGSHRSSSVVVPSSSLNLLVFKELSNDEK
jgi:hypothetical protein